MTTNEVYFKDQLFSVGKTEIYNQDKQIIGYIDLESMFSSSITIYNAEMVPLIKGKFRFFSNKWAIMNVVEGEEEIGIVRTRFSFVEKRFEYEAFNRGVYNISSPVFSREYTVTDREGKQIANFKKINGFFESSAFSLQNQTDQLTWLELIAVIMGLNEIQKRQRNN